MEDGGPAHLSARTHAGPGGAAPRLCPAAPEVSVLIPIRNGAAYLDDALESLTAQSFRNFEIIVVDNRSTDRTPALLAAWAEREPRLRTYRLDANLSRSLNHAAQMARAPLLARLDVDDLACRTRLEVQVARMRAQPAIGLLGSAVELIDARNRPIGEARPPSLDRDIRRVQQTGCGVVPSSAIMRAELFWKAGGYRD